MSVLITRTEIDGLLVAETKIFGDERGFFYEAFSQKTWGAAGFSETFVQDNLSKSAKGTLRGLHYQVEPHGMGKLVRVLRGAIWDVAVDLRRGSPTFAKWMGHTLTGENGLALWVPVGFAHGFISLEDDTLVYYKCTNTYTPEAERSVLYCDPAIGIEWPIEPTSVSKKDTAAPLLDKAEYNFTY